MMPNEELSIIAPLSKNPSSENSSSLNSSFNIKETITKIIIVGNEGVGKTSLLGRYLKDEFITNVRPTIGMDIFSKKIVNGKKELNLQFWDTAGQENFRSLIKSFYKGALVSLICFSITSLESFNSAIGGLSTKNESWFESINNSSNCKNIILVGTKSDLIGKREVNFELIEKACNRLNIPYFETSAYFNDNIKNLMNYLEKNIVGDDYYNNKNCYLKINKRKIINNGSNKCSC